MKIFFFRLLICSCFLISSPLFAATANLDPCVEIAHCSREEWDVKSLNDPMKEVKRILELTPRTKITELEDDYIHAEVTSKWMKYVDDLEIAYFPDKNNLQIRSESRVGESDLGVNNKRVELLKFELFKNNP